MRKREVGGAAQRGCGGDGRSGVRRSCVGLRRAGVSRLPGSAASLLLGACSRLPRVRGYKALTRQPPGTTRFISSAVTSKRISIMINLQVAGRTICETALSATLRDLTPKPPIKPPEPSPITSQVPGLAPLVTPSKVDLPVGIATVLGWTWGLLQLIRRSITHHSQILH
jgi:hypothetical protein